MYYRSTVKADRDDSQRRSSTRSGRSGSGSATPRRCARLSAQCPLGRAAAFRRPLVEHGRCPARTAIRTGSPYQLAEPDREALIADLLTPDVPLDAGSPLYGDGSSDRQYVEARIEPGDTVTIVGRALPFGALADPSEADVGGGGVLPADDPEVLMNIAEAREAGSCSPTRPSPGATRRSPGSASARPLASRFSTRPQIGPRLGRPRRRRGRADLRHRARPAGGRRRPQHATDGVARRADRGCR